MTAVSRLPDGTLAFRWHQIDKIFGALPELGLRPFVELNAMPVALASGTDTMFDWRMNITPPRDYAEWGCSWKRLPGRTLAVSMESRVKSARKLTDAGFRMASFFMTWRLPLCG